MLNTIYATQTPAAYTYRVRRVADRQYWDPTTGAFTAAPGGTLNLPADPDLAGLYWDTLTTTVGNGWTDGQYAVIIQSGGAAQTVLLANLAGGSDEPAGGGADPWGVALPGGYSGTQAGYLLAHLDTLVANLAAAGAGGAQTPDPGGPRRWTLQSGLLTLTDQNGLALVPRPLDLLTVIGQLGGPGMRPGYQGALVGSYVAPAG